MPVEKAPQANPATETNSPYLLEIRNLKMHFPVKGGVFMREKACLKAVDGVNLHLEKGETLGLVGESGCGKSTLGKCILRLYEPTDGQILFDGTDITRSGTGELKPLRRNVQMIFQDPAESLNSRLTIGEILEEPFIIHRIGSKGERKARVAELLDKVGLGADAADRFPFEFSGGQRQRIGIARAIALNPRLVVCDEPVSALDVSVQSQIINLMLDLQRELDLSYIFIAHDLAVVKHISDRIAIMYLGRIVELADADSIFTKPLHAYTKALLRAIPKPDPRSRAEAKILHGEVPSPIDPPKGCAFASRSPLPHSAAQAAVEPVWKEIEPGHWVDVHPATVQDWKEHLSKEERARFEV